MVESPSYGHAKSYGKGVKNRVVENRLLFPPSPVINPDEFINRALRFLKILGKSRVLLAASGGIDSMIVGELLHRVLGDDVWFVHIDTGFMRPGESKKVASFIDERYGNLVYVNDANEFIRTMRVIENAEAKRRKFSKMYFRILEDVVSRMDAEYISQGTIWPDIVESMRVGVRSVIKS